MAILTLWGLAFAVWPDLMRRFPFEAAFYGGDLPGFYTDTEAMQAVDFYTSLMGAVMAGWFGSIFLGLGVRRRAVWDAALGGIALWFVADSVASMVQGFPVNALINLGLVVLAVPLLLLSRPSE
jgi:hypothetical protein